MSDTRLVYSSETGRICPTCQTPLSECACKKKRAGKAPSIASDGTIRIRRETKGRKGKTVTAVTGFDLGGNGLNAVAKQLKQHCGSGGSVKGGLLIIQGDHRDKIKNFLERQGFKVKLAGG